MPARKLHENEGRIQDPDPDRITMTNSKLFTQPYDLVLSSLFTQIQDKTIHLRNLSGKPKFQRWYVWSDTLASRLIESILLNVPIPPCYLAQNTDFTLDVIDGQQRIFTLYRFIDNRFKLRDLEILQNLNGKAFHELHSALSRKISTYTLRCIVITNDSDPEIQFEVFERLNTNTVPLNAQELRNSICRGDLIDLLGQLVTYQPWLDILHRKQPDKRMRDEELILRFYAFQIEKPHKYRTPQKYWLNDVAKRGRSLSELQISNLANLWKDTVDKCLMVFPPHECFRRLPLSRPTVINRALMDLTMFSFASTSASDIKRHAKDLYNRYLRLLQDEEFSDLITRSTDHRLRTLRRFDLWSEQVTSDLV